MTTDSKHLALVAVAGFLISVLSFVIWIYTNQKHGEVYFGRVNTVASTTISVIDHDGAITTIRLATTTTYWRGKNTITRTDIHTGDFIQISGEKVDGARAFDATAIRLMKAPTDRPRL